jgi:hypothetical protein
MLTNKINKFLTDETAIDSSINNNNASALGKYYIINCGRDTIIL